MKITVINAGKRFNREWIFRNQNLELNQGTHYAITGYNGSGKSTFLQSLAGALYINEGEISYSSENQKINEQEQYKYFSICAPYMELIEEMTALEFLNYHQSFKPYIQEISPLDILEEIGLLKAKDKQIRYYSSGMKQRVKLAQAFFTDTPILFLDEPCTNLDQLGIDLYKHLIQGYCKDKLVVISSNDKTEYASCSQEIRMGV